MQINRKVKTEYIGIKTYIADMESDGVYFTEEQKDILEKERTSKVCQYSGLPSVASYTEE